MLQYIDQSRITDIMPPMLKPRGIFKDSRVIYFLISMFVFGTAIGLYSGVLNNYLHEILSISRLERGMIEFPRELPGLLLFVIMAVLYRISETRLIRYAFFVSLAGLIGLSMFGSYRIAAIALIVLWSTGEHLIMPIRQSIAIHSAAEGKTGLAMGTASSFGHVGQVSGFYLVPLIFFIVVRLKPDITQFGKFRTIFIVAAGVILLGLLLTGKLADSDARVKRQRLNFERKYLKYYILEAFFGARKQVFLTFAPYVLILNYGAKTELIAFLYGLWSLSNIVISPLMGKLIDKVGYKLVIVVDAAILMVLCILYGFSHHLFPERTAFLLICVVFVLDAILFVVGMARSMYANSLSGSQEELTSTLSTGISVNHLISIIIAILGGVLWETLGIEVLFSLAAVFGLGSLLFSLTLPAPSSSIRTG